MQWHNIKNIKEKLVKSHGVTGCPIANWKLLNPLFFIQLSCSRPLAFKIVTSLNSPATFYCNYTKILHLFTSFHSPVCLLFLSNLSFNKEKKEMLQNLPICDKDATVGNIEYIVSFFSIKKSPLDISLKNHSLIDRVQYQMFKKSSQSSFSLVTFRFFFKKTIKKLYRMGFKPFSHFLFFFFAINYLYEKTWFWMCCIFFLCLIRK